MLNTKSARVYYGCHSPTAAETSTSKDGETSVLHHSILDFPSRGPRNDCPRLDVLQHGRPGSDDRTFANDHARPHKSVRGYPSPRSDRYRRCNQRQVGPRVIVAGTAQIAVLTDSGIRAEPNLVHAITIHVISEATVILHLEIPWRPNFGGGINVNIFADASPEQPQ